MDVLWSLEVRIVMHSNGIHDDADDPVSDVEPDDDSSDADVISQQSVVIISDSDSPVSAVDHGDDSTAILVIVKCSTAFAPSLLSIHFATSLPSTLSLSVC